MSYTRLDASDFVVSADSVVAPAWSTGLPTLTSFYSASTEQLYNRFYLDVYDADPASDSTATVQFSIAYGNVYGSGSQLYNTLIDGKSPTRTTYGQYRNLLYADENALFNFGVGCSASYDMMAINIERNRYKESLFPGTLRLILGNSTDTIELTDDSNDTSVVTYLDCGRVYNLVSGSYGSATAATPVSASSVAGGYTPSGSYGLFLPDIGTIILNPRALSLPYASGGLAISWDESSNPSLPSSSVNNTNMFDIFQSGSCFQLNSQETVSANYIFTRVKNGDYNYTSNPSFLSGSSGQLIYSTLINNPQTYPTSVGLYNDNNELLAVAKLSRPLKKDFTTEALVKVKLDW